MRRALAVLGLALVALVPIRPAAAQDFHLFTAFGSSGYDDFESTSGIGLAATFWLTDGVGVQITLDQRGTDPFDRTGVACLNVTVLHRCNPERITTENRFSSGTASLVHLWEVADILRVGGGGGVVIGSTESMNEPESGRQPRIFIRESAHVGVLGLLDVRVQPLATLPIFLSGQLQGRYVSLDACTDDEAIYDPFCGDASWTEVQLGIGLTF